MILTTTILKWGNSQGIRLPKVLLEMLKWENNDKIQIISEKDFIKIRKVGSQKKNIKELFKDYDGNYKCSEIDWGEKEGKEVW